MKSILLVTRDARVSAALAELLSGDGFALAVAEDVAEAASHLSEGVHPGLILVDPAAPGVDLDRLRAAKAEVSRLAHGGPPDPGVLETARRFCS